MSPRILTRYEPLLALALFFLVTLLAAPHQAIIGANQGQGWDGTVYCDMARQLAAHQRPVQVSPFIFRPGTALLAAWASPKDVLLGFFIVNFLAGAILSVLMAWWLRLWITHFWLRSLLNLLFLAHWLGPVRLPWFYPALVDAWSLVFLLAGLLWMKLDRDRTRTAWALAAVGFIGVFFRETAFLTGFAFIFIGQGPRLKWKSFRSGLALRCLPLIATLAGWALLHAWVVEVNYWHWSYGPIALKRLLHFPLVQVLLACFGAFGPLAIGLFFRLRALRQVFQKDLSYTVYFLLALLLVILAGGEERYLFYWLSPLVLAALGVAWAAPGHLFQKAPLFALALSAQAVSDRWFWATPTRPLADLGPHPLIVLTPLGENGSFPALLASYETPEIYWPRLLQYVLLGLFFILAQVWADRRKKR